MSAPGGDCIRIEGLELTARVGVPDEEREEPQRLTANLLLELERAFGCMSDQIESTVDYFALSRAVQEVARAGSRRLLETLAAEIASRILRDFAVRTVTLELRKYVLADAAFVAVRIRRSVRMSN